MLKSDTFFISLYSKTCQEPSNLSTFVMLSSISDDVKGEVCRQSFARPRGSIRGGLYSKLIREASIRWKGRQIS